MPAKVTLTEDAGLLRLIEKLGSPSSSVCQLSKWWRMFPLTRLGTPSAPKSSPSSPVSIETIVMSVLVAQVNPELDDPEPLKALAVKTTPTPAYCEPSVVPGERSSKLIVWAPAAQASNRPVPSSPEARARVICSSPCGTFAGARAVEWKPAIGRYCARICSC